MIRGLYRSLAIVVWFSLLLSSALYSVGRVSAAGPSMRFDPERVTVGVGEQFDANIIIDTAGEQAAGAGAKLVYDPTRVSVVAVSPGLLFADYPIASFDNETGKATLSGIVASISSLFSGTGILGTVTFQAIIPGSHTVRFEHTPGSTTDSNIAVTYGTGDVLVEVGLLRLNAAAVTKPQSLPNPPQSSLETKPQDEEKSLIDNILTWLGWEPDTDLDPIGPITRQQPKTDPDQLQDEFIGSIRLIEDGARSWPLILAGIIGFGVGFGVMYWWFKKKHPD